MLGQPVSKDYCDATVSIARQLQEKIIHLCGYKADEQLLEVHVTVSLIEIKLTFCLLTIFLEF